MKRYFIPPPFITLDGYSYMKDFKTYSSYNYLRPEFSSRLKTRHFEIALRLTSKYFYKSNVIDFGCADGCFLPSLAKYFNHVVAIDVNLNCIALASKVVSKLGIDNVDLICNRNLTIKEIVSKYQSKEYHILFMLEILEHIGNKNNMYESKLSFLREVSNLICDEGIIVISVPKMVGISFLFQRFGLWLFKMNRKSISLKDLIKASIFNDTSDLEKRWEGGHLGFNHKKLKSALEKSFNILEEKNDYFQVIYVLEKKSNLRVK